MKLTYPLALHALVVATFCPAYALDCRNASLQVEKLICITPELKKADDVMGAAYFKLLRQTTDAEFHEALIRSQRRWLQARSRGFSRIEGMEDEESDDRKVLLKITTDRINFLKGTVPIRAMEQQRRVAAKDSGGPFAGYAASCEFLPPRYGNWDYVCWVTTHRQHMDRICSVVEDWATGHTTERRLVSVVNNGEPKPVASCYTGYAGKTCPDRENNNEIGVDAHWNTNPQPSATDLRPPRPRSLWKYDPDSHSETDTPWMRDCLFASTYPPPDMSQPDPVRKK